MGRFSTLFIVNLIIFIIMLIAAAFASVIAFTNPGVTVVGYVHLGLIYIYCILMGSLTAKTFDA